MEYKPEGRRSVGGRHILRWMDGVIEDVRKLGVRWQGIGSHREKSLRRPRPERGCSAYDAWAARQVM